MSTIGERIREERQRLEKSQEDFGAIGHVTRRTQVNYESGERTPDAEYLAAVAAEGVDVAFVLTGVRSSRVRYETKSQATVETTGSESVIYRLESPSSPVVPERDVCSIILDVLHERGRTLPSVKVWAIVDAVMALQRAGISVDKSTVDNQLRLVK